MLLLHLSWFSCEIWAENLLTFFPFFLLYQQRLNLTLKPAVSLADISMICFLIGWPKLLFAYSFHINMDLWWINGAYIICGKIYIVLEIRSCDLSDCLCPHRLHVVLKKPDFAPSDWCSDYLEGWSSAPETVVGVSVDSCLIGLLLWLMWFNITWLTAFMVLIQPSSRSHRRWFCSFEGRDTAKAPPHLEGSSCHGS